jgi:hypothetical protein
MKKWFKVVNVKKYRYLKTFKSLTKLISTLGPTDSGSNIVRLKPFSASIFKFFIWIFATITKIYTKELLQTESPQSFFVIFTHIYSFKFHS